MTDWPAASTNPNIPNRGRREKARVTLQLTAQQKGGLDWLSRYPVDGLDRLPDAFREVARKPARTIAFLLSGQQIDMLATLWSSSRRD